MQELHDFSPLKMKHCPSSGYLNSLKKPQVRLIVRPEITRMNESESQERKEEEDAQKAQTKFNLKKVLDSYQKQKKQS